MLKRIVSLLLALVLIGCAAALCACKKEETPETPSTQQPTPSTEEETEEEDDTVFASGTVGTIIWEVHRNGTMYLKGSGVLEDYDSPLRPDPWADQPWYAHGGSTATIRSDAEMGTIPVTKLVIGEGITALGAYAFSHFESLVAVELPASLTTVSYKAFENCEKLRTVTGGIGIVTIEAEAFRGCTALECIEISTPLRTVQSSAFDNLREIADADRKLTLRFRGTQQQGQDTLAALTLENGNSILQSGSVMEYVS